MPQTDSAFTLDPTLAAAVARLGPGPLDEESLRTHVWPLFSRTLAATAASGDIYLANHSLGRPLDQTAHDVTRALDLWYTSLDDAWGPWWQEMNSFRMGIARLIASPRWDAVVPKMNAGQGLRAVLNAIDHPRPIVVASEAEFDSLDFILRTYQLKQRAQIRWVPALTDQTIAPGVPMVLAQDYLRAIDAGPAPHLVLCSQIVFATGQLVEDLELIIAAARARSAWSMIDCYHSAGVVPIDLAALDADFAVGGSYKYTRGGPGCCWLAIHPRHLPEGNDPQAEGKPRTLDTGWFAKLDTFKYQRPLRPLLSSGGDAWLESTFAVLPFFQARAGLHLTLALGVDRLREYSLAQQAFLAAQLHARNVPVTRLPRHGAFLLIPHRDAASLCTRLKPMGLNADARAGHVRLCPDILTTRQDMSRAASILAAALA